jgi:hypothetical protein
VADLAAADALTVLAPAPTGTTWYGRWIAQSGAADGRPGSARPLQLLVVRAQAFD